MKDVFEGKNGPLLIAEIGGNHEGNFEYAKELVRLAIDSGVDCIKLQVYTGESLVSSLESPDRHAHFRKFELTKNQHIQLAEMIREAEIRYTSSVWDLQSIEWIDPYMDIYKIGSGDLTAYPLVKAISKLGKPIILSTGLSTGTEVQETVDYIRSINSVYENKSMLAILQCTSMYPINDSDAHLEVMKSLRQLTRSTTGYSDHTVGFDALTQAYCMGAEVLEFHFTDSREGKKFRDHKVSLTPSEIDSLIKKINKINELKGTGNKKPLPIEIETGHLDSFRRAVYPSRDIKAGELLSDENITVLRPNHGIDAREYDRLIGKEMAVDVKKHQKLEWQMIR